MKVKQLVWEETGEVVDLSYNMNARVLISESILHDFYYAVYHNVYEARYPEGNYRQFDAHCTIDDNFDYYGTKEQCKSACQEHYENLILSGLETEDE
jgi:hypothetical protein